MSAGASSPSQQQQLAEARQLGAVGREATARTLPASPTASATRSSNQRAKMATCERALSLNGRSTSNRWSGCGAGAGTGAGAATGQAQADRFDQRLLAAAQRLLAVLGGDPLGQQAGRRAGWRLDAAAWERGSAMPLSFFYYQLIMPTHIHV